MLDSGRYRAGGTGAIELYPTSLSCILARGVDLVT
jgi:hypothetical protein